MSVDIEQRKLAAIMFTDMVGYSALSQRDDKLALELLEEHRRLLREIFPSFHGTEIKTIGDAFLVEFNSALEAAQCAIEIQRALVKRNADVPPDRRIELKIGIHIGDVVHRGGDVYGDGVNIASRIEPLAGAGGICISMDVERQIRNAVETRFEKLAPTDLKNISVPMDLFRIVLPWETQPPLATLSQTTPKARSNRGLWIAAAVIILLLIIGIGWWWTTVPHKNNASAPSSAVASGQPNIPDKSIAVLPFENLSHDPDNAYFADGVQDEILTRLSKIADLKVISRTSTQHYKSAPDNLREIARQLEVAHILEGSVQKSGDSVRVNVQLIKAANDSHLWADTFDRKLTDIFSVESEVAKAIADQLRAKLTGSEKRAIAAKPTEDSEAHEFYLKGRYFWNKRTANDFKTAISYFEQAIDKDPGYALAYAGLADSYGLLSAYGVASPQESFPQAKTAAKKALELDETLAEAHAALAHVLFEYDLDFDGSNREFQRAIELNPNYAMAHHWLGNGPLAQSGRFDEAIAEGKRAVELDPLSVVINTDLGDNYYFARRYDDAIEQLRKTLEMDPGFYYARYTLGQALEAKGDVAAAIEEYQKARALNDDPFVLALLGHAYAASGNKTEALKILDQLKDLSKQRYVSAYSFALVYLGLDDKEEALHWLQKSYQDRAGFDIAAIKVDPFLDPLRGDPRFEQIVASLVPK